MNNNITEDYCSFEVSKLLKEKGFDNQCSMIQISGESHPMTTDMFDSGYDGNFSRNSELDHYKQEVGFKHYLKGKEILMIPTHALAIKWIRENFKLFIYIRLYNNLSSYYSYMFTIAKVTRGMNKVLHSSGIRDKENKPYWYDTPEEATEAALLYTLKNLI